VCEFWCRRLESEYVIGLQKIHKRTKGLPFVRFRMHNDISSQNVGFHKCRSSFIFATLWHIMEQLALLFGGQERVKIMRYFLHHEDAVVTLEDVEEKTKSKSIDVKHELSLLLSVGFIEKKKAKMYIVTGKREMSKTKEVIGFGLCKEFPHNQALKDLLFDFQLLDKKELGERFRMVGRIKLFIVAGVFIGDPKSRVDILIVGESIKKPKAEKIIEGLSAELGRDVVFSVMDLDEFEYRFKMYDKFVRDIMSMPHEKVIDKMKAGGE
jgi:hypothetical protein